MILRSQDHIKLLEKLQLHECQGVSVEGRISISSYASSSGDDSYFPSGGRARGLDETSFLIESSGGESRVITIQREADRNLLTRWFVRDVTVDQSIFLISFGGNLVVGSVGRVSKAVAVELGGCHFLAPCCGDERYVAVGRTGLALIAPSLQITQVYHDLDIRDVRLEGEDTLVLNYDTPLESRTRRYGICRDDMRLDIESDD